MTTTEQPTEAESRRPAKRTAAKATTKGLPQAVLLIGCGPGDPDLLTVRAAAALAEADAILVAPGVPRELLVDLPGTIVAAPGGVPDGVPDAAKEAASRARAGERVVRLVPGDVFLHPDVSREAAALTRSKVGFELVPGVSPAVAVPGYGGVAVGVPHTVVS